MTMMIKGENEMEISPEKEKMHMFQWYQDFYHATKDSKAYARFCELVFGMNISQHGFSDMHQLQKLIEVTRMSAGNAVLDIGCGNGLMAEYFSDLTGACVFGIDYSPEAISKLKTER